MTLLEVLKKVNDDVWFRPVSWKLSGRAITLIRGEFYVVPGKSGGIKYMPTKIKEYLSEWEIVDPDIVISEIH